MSQWVAVDGGQSGLRLRAVPDGGRGHGPGFRYRGGDPVPSMVAAIERAATDAGLAGPVTALCAGLSGLPVEFDQLRTLAARLSASLAADRVLLTTDVVTAHAGALPSGVGVVVAAGTGVNCLGVDPAGRSHRTDGWGHLFGDAGSAFDIGRRAISAVQRRHDGRGGPTDLVDAARQWFGVDPDLLPQQLYWSETVVAEVASFAPAVVACAEQGDQDAGRIVRRAAQELARTVAAACGDLEFDDQPIPVARVGRLWEAGDILSAPFEAELARLDPRGQSVRPAGDALAGAERLARGGPGRYRGLLHEFSAEDLGTVGAVPPTRRTRVQVRAPTTKPDAVGAGGGGPAFGPGSLIVSCQAQPDSPLYGPESMAAMALAAVAGGAAGIRVNGEADIAAVCSVLSRPVIGLLKQGSRSGVYITPTVPAAEAVVHAGADIVALDGTTRPRLDGADLAEQIAAVHRLEAAVLADVDSLAAGLAARQAGADLVATSLAGYTGELPPPDEPDLELLAGLVEALDCPVIAEGRYRTAADLRAALERGAYAVVIGTAITNPTEITRRILDG